MSFEPKTIIFRTNDVTWTRPPDGSYPRGITLDGATILPGDTINLDLSTTALTAQNPGRPLDTYSGYTSNYVVVPWVPVTIMGTLTLGLDEKRTHCLELRPAARRQR